MAKAKPMSVAEFAKYSQAIPVDRHEEFNRMLSFVEDTVMRRVCRIVCTDCDCLGDPVLKDGVYWHHHHASNRDYPCRAEHIRVEMAKEQA